ncbi:DUF5998 family protein [Brooklawnia cerclae]|uniref:Phosphodiesterase n=1 Tax=Brooklawnia cerclae TaxID=349934 RepID=A0ABX0SF12_9ACTN|nr:DUF5998 family protein [Brooklawnia cerclae]NIH56949.1 hypothetical protein [Brooklawnia cerclae]
MRDTPAEWGQLPRELAREITDCGFFPQLVADSVALGLGDERVDEYLVHHEATFAHEGISRHLSVLVLTPTRLIVSHTDENTDDPAGATAISSTESVPLRLLGAVALTRVAANPERFGTSSSQVVETWLTLSWETMRRIDLEPATCGDPTCEADHGFTGSDVGEDMVVRMSSAADGAENVARLVRFGTALQQKVR